MERTWRYVRLESAFGVKRKSDFGSPGPAPASACRWWRACSTARNTFRPTHPAAGPRRGARPAVRASLGHRSPHHDAALAQDGGNARRAAVELAVEGGLRAAALAQHLADRNATGGSQDPGGKTTP